MIVQVSKRLVDTSNILSVSCDSVTPIDTHKEKNSHTTSLTPQTPGQALGRVCVTHIWDMCFSTCREQADFRLFYFYIQV